MVSVLVSTRYSSISITVRRFLRKDAVGGAYIRRNLCIREGVRIHTPCVYTPTVLVYAPTRVYTPGCIYRTRCVYAVLCTHHSRIRTDPAYTHPCLVRIRTSPRIYAPWGAFTHPPAYTHPPPRTSTYAFTRRRVRKRTYSRTMYMHPTLRMFRMYTRGRDERVMVCAALRSFWGPPVRDGASRRSDP